MTNALTGDFDVVAEISVDAVNRILAAQHQNGVFLHSFWASIPLGGVDDGTGLRGIAEVQVSTPSITILTTGFGPRITIHFDVMVHFKPAPGSASLPEYIHGEIRATIDIGQGISSTEDLIEIDFNSTNVDITFWPAAGSLPLDASQRALVERAVENFLTTGFEPENIPVMLSTGGEFSIRYWRFKPLADVFHPALALLLNIRNISPQPEQVSSFWSLFLENGDDFAIAIGRDFLVMTLQQKVRDELDRYFSGKHFNVSMPWPLPDCTYTIALNSVSVDLREGQINIVISGRATTPGWCPNYDFSVDLALTLRIVIDPIGENTTNSVRLDMVGEPNVRISGFLSGFIVGPVEGFVSRARNQFLIEAQPMINNVLAGLSNFLTEEELQIPSLDLTYTAVAIQPDGVVVHGTLGFRPFVNPVVDFEATSGSDIASPIAGVVFNALESWIPGGTIQRYNFSASWGSFRIYTARSVEDHQFVTTLRAPTGTPFGEFYQPVRVCVEVRGTQPRNTGGGLSEVWYRSCKVLKGGLPRPGWIMDEVRPRIPIAMIAGETLTGHFDAWAEDEGASPAPSENAANLILHFTDAQFEMLPVLSEAITKGVNEKTAASVIVVLPPGTLDKARSLVKDGGLTWAEDFEGSWAQTFKVKETPATFVIDPQGELAWQQDGKLDAKTLTAVFKENLKVVEGKVRRQQLRLAVREGKKARDFSFEYLDEQNIVLRRLRGRPVILNFWKSWSEPCLEELRRLQKMHEALAQKGLVVIAVNDGEDPERARKAFKENNFTFKLVIDKDRTVSRLYGVNFWPTTVSINELGVVHQIQFGLAQADEFFEPLEAHGSEQH
jgi:peroxiredoxin